MVNAPESMLRATQLPEGDFVRIVLEQHERIRDLFGQIHNVTGKRKQDTFDELRRLLAVHEAAEEMIVRPMTRAATGGGSVASARNHEEHMAAHLLADLEKTDISSETFSAVFSEFEKKVVEHAEHEEEEELPLILKTRNEQQRVWLGKALQAVETIAPTHPHPTSAGSTTAQYVLGPFASLLDHARDALKKVMPA
ncbi:MAG: hemerythrin domain-containing protein [Micromonosporaceae bacterium]